MNNIDLAKKRKEYNLTQIELAKKLNMSIFTIQNLEQNKRGGSEETWQKINKYFEMRDKVKMNNEKSYIIRINEKTTMRGMNSLYYQIELWSTKNKFIESIPYQKNITKMLHESPIFNFFKDLDGKELESVECLEYCEKLKRVIKMLENVAKIY